MLKPSFKYVGNDLVVFSRGGVLRLRWSRDVDVFCAEVNPDDGDVYKAELLNGRVLIAWKSASPPLRELFRRGMLRGVRGAYGDRSPCEFPPGVKVKLEVLSRVLTDNGLGHVSVDFMRRSDGELVAIELNPRGVATWWTRQFAHYRERYAEALYELTLRHRFEHSTSQTEPGRRRSADHART